MMDCIELIKAAVFGLVEGISEWLPISSTGHLLLLNNNLKLSLTEEFWNLFLVVIQFGAILAICVLFFTRLNPFDPRKSVQQKKSTWSLWAKTIVACLPAAIIGIPFDDWIEEHLGSPAVIAGTLIGYGTVFIVLETLRNRRFACMNSEELSRAQRRASVKVQDKKLYQPQHLAVQDLSEMSLPERADACAQTRDLEHLSWKTALGIGVFQILSIIPGTSRSGSTILGGLLLGCSRPVAAEFTFFLAIPVMLGASALRVVKYLMKGLIPTGAELAILGVGCAVAFLVSIVTVRWLMSFVRRHSFTAFGWYRIVLGLVVIAFLVFKLI